MSSKPKKTLTEEQLQKMKEGRKKAIEKRKQEREEAKAKALEFDVAKKQKDKQKLLELEMEALQQQQDRIDNLRLQVERKKEVKSKLKRIKQTEEKPEDQVFETKEKVIDDDEYLEIEEAEDVIETIEDVGDILHSEAKHLEEEPPNVPNDEEYSEVFKREANKMRKNIPVDVRHLYDDAVKKFDFTLSLDDNIKSMIDYVKDVVQNNTELANRIRNKQIQKENKKEVVQKSVNEKVAEQAIDSKLSKLMKMKY